MKVSIPEIESNSFEPMTWCPMMVKTKEQEQFLTSSAAKGSKEFLSLQTALNQSSFRGSLKNAYGGKSMALPF